MNLASRIRYLREKRGVSQEHLAALMGVSLQTVAYWESEMSVPNIETIIILSEYFEVTTDYLLKGEDNNKERNTWRNSLLIGFVFIITVTTIVMVICVNRQDIRQTLLIIIAGALVGGNIAFIVHYLAKIITQ